jgi:hypothetical protein
MRTIETQITYHAMEGVNMSVGVFRRQDHIEGVMFAVEGANGLIERVHFRLLESVFITGKSSVNVVVFPGAPWTRHETATL